jgi:hypothetical protein
LLGKDFWQNVTASAVTPVTLVLPWNPIKIHRN